MILQAPLQCHLRYTLLLLACLQLGINPNAKEMKEELCFYGNAGPTRTRSYWAQLQVGWPVLCVVATTQLDLQSQQLKIKSLIART
jgi:hypothetical protein